MPPPAVAKGNILALLDKDGSIVVKYTYDVRGNHTVEDSTKRIVRYVV